jgi:hypothetical protein
MLILNEDLFKTDKIVKMYCSDKWENTDEYYIISKSVMNRLKILLIESYKNKEECILLVDFNEGETPPMSIMVSFLSFMVSIKEHLEKGLKYTIVYTTSLVHKSWIENILKIYKPIKKIYIVSDKDDIKKYLLNKND